MSREDKRILFSVGSVWALFHILAGIFIVPTEGGLILALSIIDLVLLLGYGLWYLSGKVFK